MRNTVKLAVLIPTYKPSIFLYQCLNSLKNQTISAEYFEIIIVLNGDKYPYFKIIKDWVNELKINNIEIFYNEKKGVSAARNFGIENSTSEFILFVDDDDIISTNYIEGLLTDTSENSLRVSNLLSFTDQIHNSEPDYLTQAFSKFWDKKHLRIFKNRSFFSSSCAKLISRKAANKSKFRVQLCKHEDALFMFEISCGIKTVTITDQDVIYYRRLRPDSVSRRKEKIWIALKNIFIYEYWLFYAFLSKPNKYNLLFFLSRVVAPLKTL